MARGAVVGMSNNASAGVLIGLLALYFGIHFLQAHDIGPEVVRYYGKDFLFLPALMLCVRHAAQLGGITFHFAGKHLLIALLYTIAVFEILLPTLSSKYHRDPMDVAAYALGSVICYAALRRIKTSSSKVLR